MKGDEPATKEDEPAARDDGGSVRTLMREDSGG